MSLVYLKFKDVNLKDTFFDSLRNDYNDFDSWFLRKVVNDESAYVYEDDNKRIQGFLYLKLEEEQHDDIMPKMPLKKRIKVGTLKINAHGTRLGQRFIKKIMDYAIDINCSEVYLTVFQKHIYLIELLKKYGFSIWGEKNSKYGKELVMIKYFLHNGDVVKSYPIINASGVNIYLLSINPIYHTKLFPDSKLNTESVDIIKDVSETNSIEKIYMCNMQHVEALKCGDIIVIYRTKEKGTAEYSSVATSICVVTEMKWLTEFHSEEQFIKYAIGFSVFDKRQLIEFWKTKKYPKIIRFLYNCNLKHRLTRKFLIQEIKLNREAYFGFLKLTENQFRKIVVSGQVNENIVIY